jgi:translation initiation factor 3 subunit A
LLARKEVIQKRKEEASELQAAREKENARQKRLKEQALLEAEQQRLAKEQAERAEKRLKDEQDRVRKEELKKQIADLKMNDKNLNIDLNDLDNLDSNRIRAMKLAQLEREKNDVNERLRITGKRMDHLERAFRKEESKKLHEDYERQSKDDRAIYDKVKAKTLKEAEEKHTESVELKHRLSRLVPLYESFRESVYERRRDEFEKRRRDAERELEKQIAARKKEVRDRKLREKREREEHERQLREAEEKAAREKEEQRIRDEARKAELAKLKEQREQERQEMLEKAALQQRREDEALARRKAEKEKPSIPIRGAPEGEGRKPPVFGAGKWREREASNRDAGDSAPSRTGPPMDRTDSNDRAGGPPRLALAGNKPSWREREAAKQASGGAGGAENGPPPRSFSRGGGAPMERSDSRSGENGRTQSPAPAAEPLQSSRAPGKWVPPHMRK